MNIKKHVYNYVRRRNLMEGITEEGTPDSKYYAFDWDDNLMYMPTQIVVLTENEEEVGMSTEDFADHRQQIGVEPFNYKGTVVVGYAPMPFRYFKEEGDKRFIIDSMTAPVGPAWNDFIECINGGSIFSIITARGHNPETLKEAVRNLIISNKNGIDNKRLIGNLKKYESLVKNIKEQVDITDSDYSGKDLIERYLDRCKFYPVTFGEGSAANPEELKIKVMREFINYCKVVANEIVHKPGKFKNDVANHEIDPTIGFSDDDPRNIDKMKDFLEKEYEKSPVRLYLTKGGEKKEV
jgi:hypothetical protein